MFTGYEFEEYKRGRTYCFGRYPIKTLFLRFCKKCRILESFEVSRNSFAHKKLGKITKRQAKEAITRWNVYHGYQKIPPTQTSQ
jgi:hypothetical protein